MYQIMIVEDDQFFRINFINMVSWELMDCQIASIAKNGEEAVKYLQEHSIDIVITDVEMPFMNGVQLNDYIHIHYPHIKCVVLSNFDSFDYVKECMKNGASEYLLKHQLTEHRIKTVMKNLLVELNISKTMQNKVNPGGRAVQSIKPMVKQNYLRALLAGSMGDTLGPEYFDTLFPEFAHTDLYVVVFKIDNYYRMISEYGREKQMRFQNTFINICEQTVQKIEQGIVVHMEAETFCILFSSPCSSSMLYLTSQLNMMLSHLKITLKRFFNLTCSFGISDICPNIDQLPRYYCSALHKVSQTYFEGNESMVFHAPPNARPEVFVTLDFETEKELYQAVSTGDKPLVKSLLSELFEGIKRKKGSKQNIQSLAMELVNLSIRICKNKNIDISVVYPNTSFPHNEILQYSNYEALLSYLTAKLERITGLMCFGQEYNPLTRQALMIIQTQYARELSLSMIAELLDTNSSYLSRVFKSDMKVGFAEYLSTLRLKEVQHLIAEKNIDIKSAAAQCGFINYNYFFKVFKERFGITPQEYKTQLSKERNG